MNLQLLYTDEEVCESFMEELEGLTDEEWAMLDEMSNNSANLKQTGATI